ncbi:hypothetical protein GCM10010372_51540 [Streptomyces tauricus]|nr:hypothetical protein GCM10010372_51540 [Streptomyces tauricus]
MTWLSPRAGHLVRTTRWNISHSSYGLAYALALGTAGVTVGPATAISRTAWWPHALTRAYLALRCRLP